MRIAVTGLGSWCAAGRGAASLLDLLDRGRHALTDAAPYDTTGLRGVRAGFVPGLHRERAAEILLSAVVRDALEQAGLDPHGIALVVGTSSGAFRGGLPVRDAPARELARALDLGAHATVSVACASGTAALVLAAGWVEDGAPAVVAAGVDALDLFVHAGFAGLGGLTSGLPRPFAAGRDGLALGEGAGALVLEPLERARARGAEVLAELEGVGLSCDARHMTAPHREGRGVADGLLRALADAGRKPAEVDLVSIHGTGTPYNDAMEAHALRTVFGSRPLSVHGVKHAVGHALGAAGTLEAALVVQALRDGVQPAPITDVDPELPWPPSAPPGPPRVALSTSSAFGGINAAAIFVRAGRDRRRVRREVRRLRTVEVALPPGADLRELWPEAPARAQRLDAYGKVGVWAIGRLLAEQPVPEECGVILATRTGCALADLAHHERLVAEGAARASRLAFTYTVPGAPACEAAILYDLRGPLLALVGDPTLADREAERLLRRGRARWLLSLTCEAEPGQTATARATVLVGVDT